MIMYTYIVLNNISQTFLLYLHNLSCILEMQLVKYSKFLMETFENKTFCQSRCATLKNPD